MSEMLDRADADEYLPNCPWNQEDPTKTDFEVTILLSREIKQIVTAYNEEEAMKNAVIICDEQGLGFEAEALEATEV